MKYLSVPNAFRFKGVIEEEDGEVVGAARTTKARTKEARACQGNHADADADADTRVRLMLMLMLTPPRRSSGSDSGMGGEGGLSESELLESTNAPLAYFGELHYHLCLPVFS